MTEGSTRPLTVLVCPNTLEVSGASLVALDLAAAMRERGHRVVVYGPMDDLVERMDGLGLEWIESPPTEVPTRPGRPLWPRPEVIRELRAIVAREGVDVIHSYEWPRTLEAHYGAHLLDGVPLVSSVLSIVAPKFLPRSAHVVVGTEELVDVLSDRGFTRVTLLLPRLDRVPVAPSDPSAVARFIEEHGLDPLLPRVVVASRLNSFKLDGLHLAIDALEHLDHARSVQLVIAGEGRGEEEVRTHAAEVDARLGRPAVVFTGLLSDVVPAYRAADVVLGMGTAALGGMAQAKPTVVLGQDGFSELVTSVTATALQHVGFFGVGRREGAVERLAGHLDEALSDGNRAAALGAEARAVVDARPTAEEIESRLEAVYRSVVAAPPAPATRGWAAARSFGRFAAMRGRRRVVRRFAPREHRAAVLQV